MPLVMQWLRMSPEPPSPALREMLLFPTQQQEEPSLPLSEKDSAVIPTTSTLSPK